VDFRAHENVLRAWNRCSNISNQYKAHAKADDEADHGGLDVKLLAEGSPPAVCRLFDNFNMVLAKLTTALRAAPIDLTGSRVSCGL
jgi:hypothetical protein